jgi:hypothetical protein
LPDGNEYQPGLSIHINVSFRQTATLVRNNQVMMVPTWNQGTIMGSPSSKGQNTVRAAVCDLMDKFISDYLSMNPKR